jgi:hypothetical protein
VSIASDFSSRSIEFEDLIEDDSCKDAFKDVNNVVVAQFLPTQITNIMKLLECAKKKNKDSTLELATKEKLRDEF